MADLEVRSIAKKYPTRGEPLVVLREASLQMTVGENVAIVGPSGSGKSTFLHIIGTLDQPTSGNVSLDGTNPFELPESDLARFRNQNIGFIFQEHHLLPQLSVLENVLIPTIAEGKSSAEQVARAEQLLERVGLSNRREHRPAELSGGERQRVAVARSLICNPLLLLADEPTGSLDRSNALSVTKLLLDLQQQEKTMLIVVTHSDEIARLLQKQCDLDDGVLKAGG